VHDESLEDQSLAFEISRLSHTPIGPTPIGIFRAVERPVYDALMQQQLDDARKDKGEGDLAGLLRAGDTWTIS
jgi:2-oxoglutarate ferredoxin oxidoreductase subunit beta